VEIYITKTVGNLCAKARTVVLTLAIVINHLLNLATVIIITIIYAALSKARGISVLTVTRPPKYRFTMLIKTISI
jgi:hypothetical protein